MPTATHAALPQGQGTNFDETGDTYEGEYIDGMKQGRGRAVYGGRPVDGFGGDVYEGSFLDNVK